MLTRLGLPKLAADHLPQSNKDLFCDDVTVSDLDNETVTMLTKVYALDFALLNYTATLEAALEEAR